MPDPTRRQQLKAPRSFSELPCAKRLLKESRKEIEKEEKCCAHRGLKLCLDLTPSSSQVSAVLQQAQDAATDKETTCSLEKEKFLLK